MKIATALTGETQSNTKTVEDSDHRTIGEVSKDRR